MLLVPSFTLAAEATTDSNEVKKSMQVPYEEGSLSALSFVYANKAYIKLFSVLTVYDAQSLWNDMVIITEKYHITDIHIFISSPGGSAFAGLSLADQILAMKKIGCHITAHASGIIASAAVPVFAVCDHRIAGEDTFFMVHEASIWKLFAEEKVKDLEAQLAMMKLLEKSYINKLVKHSKLSFDEWKAMEGKTSYFTAEQAKEYGIVDEIDSEK